MFYENLLKVWSRLSAELGLKLSHFPIGMNVMNEIIGLEGLKIVLIVHLVCKLKSWTNHQGFTD